LLIKPGSAALRHRIKVFLVWNQSLKPQPEKVEKRISKHVLSPQSGTKTGNKGEEWTRFTKLNGIGIGST